MASASIVVPIDHHPTTQEIDLQANSEPQSVTLLELIEAVSEVSDNEREVVATVTYMLHSGRIRLSGNFRDMPVDQLCSAALCG